MNNQKTIVGITGSKGFLGSRMLAFLQKNSSFELRPINGDLRNYENVSSQLRDCKIVFHFAADMGGVNYFSKENYRPPMNNFLIDLHVLKACEENGVKRLFYPASACAYPRYIMNSGKKLKEEYLDKPADPDQMYGWEKLTILKLAKYAPFDIRIGILHTIYGEGQEYRGEKAKFPPQIAYKIYRSYRFKEPLEIWGDGNQVRTFLHVKDAISMIYEVTMTDSYYGPVNISAHKAYKVISVVKMLCSYLKFKPRIIFNKTAPTGVDKRYADTRKYNKHYAYQEQINLHDGIASLYEYIKKNENERNT